MNPNNIYLLQAYLDMIDVLCHRLDFITCPTIEEELEDSIESLLSHDIETLINSDETSSIIGKAGLKALCQLHEMLPDDYRKGFSGTQRWIDFVTFASATNILLKDAVKRYKATTKEFM